MGYVYRRSDGLWDLIHELKLKEIPTDAGPLWYGGKGVTVYVDRSHEGGIIIDTDSKGKYCFEGISIDTPFSQAVGILEANGWTLEDVWEGYDEGTIWYDYNKTIIEPDDELYYNVYLSTENGTDLITIEASFFIIW